MLDNILDGSTVSHAPESTVISISSHPDSLSRGATIDMPIGASALVSTPRSIRGRKTLINLFLNQLTGGPGALQQSPSLHVIVLFAVESHLAALIVSMYLAQPGIPADEFSRQAGGDDPSGK